MFQKEKIIDGVLHHRETPQDEFKPYTAEELSVMYRKMEIENNDLFHKISMIREALERE